MTIYLNHNLIINSRIKYNSPVSGWWCYVKTPSISRRPCVLKMMMENPISCVWYFICTAISAKWILYCMLMLSFNNERPFNIQETLYSPCRERFRSSSALTPHFAMIYICAIIQASSWYPWSHPSFMCPCHFHSMDKSPGRMLTRAASLV
jgi:uncharacterized protein YggT (Ycf19 family)